MSKVAKYRRQVSEDPDIDSLLSTLSPEEMEELEKELDVVDSDGSISMEQSEKNQADNPPSSTQNCDAVLNHHEKEPRKRLQREQAVDVSPISTHRAAPRARLCVRAVSRHLLKSSRQSGGQGRELEAKRGFCELSESQSCCQGAAPCLCAALGASAISVPCGITGEKFAAWWESSQEAGFALSPFLPVFRPAKTHSFILVWVPFISFSASGESCKISIGARKRRAFILCHALPRWQPVLLPCNTD